MAKLTVYHQDGLNVPTLALYFAVTHKGDGHSSCWHNQEYLDAKHLRDEGHDCGCDQFDTSDEDWGHLSVCPQPREDEDGLGVGEDRAEATELEEDEEAAGEKEGPEVVPFG